MEVGLGEVTTNREIRAVIVSFKHPDHTCRR